MNKKFISFSLLALFAFSMFAGLVSAIGPNFKEMFQSGESSTISSMLNFILGKAAEQDVFTVILMLVLVTLVIYALVKPMDIFGSSVGINWGISFIVALLGVRFLPADFLTIIATPSSALVAVIVAGVPLLVLLGITRNSNVLPYVRYVWWAYAATCLILGFYNLAGVSTTVDKVNLFGWDMSVVSAVFFVLAIIGIILSIFGVWILRKMNLLKADVRLHKATSDAYKEQIAKLTQEKIDLAEQIRSGVGDSEETKTQMKELQKRIKTLEEFYNVNF